MRSEGLAAISATTASRQSLAIEFDTYRNAGDSSANTIAVVVNGKTQQTALAQVVGAVRSEQRHSVLRVDRLQRRQQFAGGLSFRLQHKAGDGRADDTSRSGPNRRQLDVCRFLGRQFQRSQTTIASPLGVSRLKLRPASPGSFALVTSQITAFESQGSITLEVQRLGGSAGDAWLDYYTEPSSAVTGEDFVYQSGQLYFADGVTSQQFTIQIVDNSDAEPTEEFSVYHPQSDRSRPADSSILADHDS